MQPNSPRFDADAIPTTDRASAAERGGTSTLLRKVSALALREINFDRILWLLALPFVFVALVALSERGYGEAVAVVANVARVFATLYLVVLGFLMVCARWAGARDLFVAVAVLALSSHLESSEERHVNASTSSSNGAPAP